MISMTEIELRRGTKVLLSDAELVIHPGQHIGIIGANGCGKSSLFKLLLGQLAPDAGNLFIPSDWRIAHMAQELASSERSALDYVLDGDPELRRTEAAIEQATDQEDNNRLAAEYEKMDAINGFDAHYRAEQLLHGLGFYQSEINRPVNSFSGGWRIRLNLAQALMSPSDLLMLDEPTNHLDLDATLWLEQWLKAYEGTLLIISHDRDFIDNVVERIVHIERAQSISYKGNYSAFERVRSERLALQQASFEKQQKRRKDVEAFVARFRYKASKAKQAQSRIKELERMENIAPAHIDSPFYFKFPEPKKTYSALVNISQSSLGYGDTEILSQVNFDLQPGTRIGLLGPNGAGKSTLINSLTGDLDLLSGQRVYGENIKMGGATLDLEAGSITSTGGDIAFTDNMTLTIDDAGGNVLVLTNTNATAGGMKIDVGNSTSTQHTGGDMLTVRRGTGSAFVEAFKVNTINSGAKSEVVMEQLGALTNQTVQSPHSGSEQGAIEVLINGATRYIKYYA